MNQNDISEIKGFLKGISAFNESFHVGLYSFDFYEVPFQEDLLKSLLLYAEKLKQSSEKIKDSTLEKISDREFKNSLKQWFCWGLIMAEPSFKEKFQEVADDLAYDFLDLINQKAERKNREIYQLMKKKYRFTINNFDPINEEYILKIDENVFILHLGWSD